LYVVFGKCFAFLGANMKKNRIHRLKVHLPEVFTQGKTSKTAFQAMTIK